MLVLASVEVFAGFKIQIPELRIIITDPEDLMSLIWIHWLTQTKLHIHNYWSLGSVPFNVVVFVGVGFPNNVRGTVVRRYMNMCAVQNEGIVGMRVFQFHRSWRHRFNEISRFDISLAIVNDNGLLLTNYEKTCGGEQYRK